MKRHNDLEIIELEVIEKFGEYLVQVRTIDENTEFLVTNKGKILNRGISDIETAINFAKQWQWIEETRKKETKQKKEIISNKELILKTLIDCYKIKIIPCNQERIIDEIAKDNNNTRDFLSLINNIVQSVIKTIKRGEEH